MKYKMSKKMSSISALNDFQGLGKEVAMELEAGKEIEIKDPPKHLIDGGYLLEAKKGDK
jgi:hypothetical protein|tara:strand:- start:665 stop:841 length:177 start_codon:yes stop_codon:yes gene_type:complete